jgi:lysophospholipase L1-like esterase
MTWNLTRRHFLTATGGALALPSWPAALSAAPTIRLAAGQTILFQGDSITDCGRDRTATVGNTGGGLGTGYPLLIAAALLKSEPAHGLEFINRGVSGDRVPDLARRWESDTVNIRPDVLSILVGVNDFWHRLFRGYAGTVEDYAVQYAALLAETKRALPRVRLIVLEPFALRCGAVDDRWYPEFDQRRAAAARVAADAGATFIPLQQMFDRLTQQAPPAWWASDGVHPTPAGHAAIADAWLQAVSL